MSRIILNEYTVTPQTPSADTLAIYAMSNALHVLSDTGVSSRLCSLKSIIRGNLGQSTIQPNNTAVALGTTVVFVASNPRYLVVISNGFSVPSSSTSWLGVRINGADTYFNVTCYSHTTHAYILQATTGTTYTINPIVRNSTATAVQTLGGFILIVEIGDSL